MSLEKNLISILEPKLDSLGRCVLRLEGKRPFTQIELETNFDLQDVISLNIERATQLCVDIAAMIISHFDWGTPTQMSESFSYLEKFGWLDSTTADRMRKAVGFRNIAVHEYEKIDWKIVFSIVENHVTDFKNFASQVIQKAKHT